MRWERRIPLWPRLAGVSVLLMLALAAPSNWQSPSSPLKKYEDPPVSDRSVSLQAPISPARHPDSLPSRQEFDFDTLIAIRDLLLQGFEQLPAPQLNHQPAEVARPVRVSSADDRLAMLPLRARALTSPTTPVFTAESGAKEPADFAAILLDAAQNPKPITTTREAVASPAPAIPQLAMRPTLAPPVEPEPEATVVEPSHSTEPTVAEPPVSEPPTPEPQPVEVPLVDPPQLRHRPQALISQLESFEQESSGAVWAQLVLAQLRVLTEESSSPRTEAAETLAQLENLFVAGIEQSEHPANYKYHNHWQQAAQALGRRLVLWKYLLDPEQPKIIVSQSSSTHLLPTLNEVANLLDEHENGLQWREYLQLDEIAMAQSEGIEPPTLARARLAQEVLSRMSDTRLNQAQVDFLTKEPLLKFRQQLRPWAAGKVNLDTLAAIIERYELGRQSRYAEALAQLQQRLKWSTDPELRILAAHLDEHYRGANMRLAISDVLLNRMLPEQKPIISPVSDRIAGARVRGRARTTTELRVRLLPDPESWHFALDAFGRVYSDTKSDTWPARIRNAAKMQYQARKEISINQRGIQTTPAQATAKGRNELVGVDSEFDPVPIVGLLLRDMAARKHKKNRPAALSQAKAKVVRTAKQRMDTALGEKLESLEQKFHQNVLAQIEQLALLAEPLEMYTTEERAVMKLRLANSGQLAAHTLRPLAPSDSVLSLQMHESALNNAMMGLGLDGRRMKLRELFYFLAERFGQAEAVPPADMPRATTIQFAKSDAARVQCDGNRLEMVLSVTELAHRRDKIRNFQIHVHFRPEIEGLGVKLVRDGTLQFSGRRLKTGPRVVLHSVIGKLIDENQEIDLLHTKIQQDPRFQGLVVTQLAFEDGWIGLALGPEHPKRTAWLGAEPELLQTPYVR